jgi:antitoxin MazE
MGTSIARWGNSLAVRLPKAVAEKAGLSEGDPIDVKVSGTGDIVLRRTRRRYTLDELVAGITPENRHEEIDFGPPVGKEVW